VACVLIFGRVKTPLPLGNWLKRDPFAFANPNNRPWRQ
jgi:hypothetical protein